MLLHPRDAPGSLPRKDRMFFCLGFSSWKDDKVGSGSDEEKGRTKQVTRSSTKNPNKINPQRNERNMRLAASYLNRNITASVCI